MTNPTTAEALDLLNRRLVIVKDGRDANEHIRPGMCVSIPLDDWNAVIPILRALAEQPKVQDDYDDRHAREMLSDAKQALDAQPRAVFSEEAIERAKLHQRQETLAATCSCNVCIMARAILDAAEGNNGQSATGDQDWSATNRDSGASGSIPDGGFPSDAWESVTKRLLEIAETMEHPNVNLPNSAQDVRAAAAELDALRTRERELREALDEIIYYQGGANSSLEDEYVMERAHAALNASEESGDG